MQAVSGRQIRHQCGRHTVVLGGMTPNTSLSLMVAAAIVMHQPWGWRHKLGLPVQPSDTKQPGKVSAGAADTAIMTKGAGKQRRCSMCRATNARTCGQWQH